MEIKFEQPSFNQDLPIFSSEKYLKTESNEYGWICGYENEKLILILPYFIYSKFIFRLLRFTNETYFFNQKEKDDYEQIFLDKLVDKIKELNIDMVMQPTTNVVFNKFPKKSISAPFGSYKINLTLDEEELWKNLHSKHRNVIRNARNKSVQIYENKYDLDEVYEFIKSTFQRSSMGFINKNKFHSQINNLGENVKIFTAYSVDGVLQGCAVIPYSQYCGYYLHGGSIARPVTGALNLLQWHGMLSLKEDGVQQYDFVGARINPPKGTKLEGIQKFKERFGATLYEGYLWKYPIKPLKSKLFTLIFKLLKKSEGDIIDQERDKI